MANYRIVPLGTWSDCKSIFESSELRSWAFRGQKESSWGLWSTLSRRFMGAKVHPNAWVGQEERILRIFQRKAHLFLDHVPPEDDAFQWLGLLQHHGAPTRLLDFTWSPYVALFFALESAEKSAAVWALNAGLLNHSDFHDLSNGARIDVRQVSTWNGDSYRKHFLLGNDPFVVAGEPRIMNRRLIAQSGTFAVPGILEQPVDAILDSYKDAADLLIKFEIDSQKVRSEAMLALYNMNLTHATLFPDLDGLARSMAYELEFHWAFDPQTMKPIPGFPPPEELDFWTYVPKT